MDCSNKVVLLKEGWNKEYTGSNQRLLDEIGAFTFITLDEGISMQIKSEEKNREEM